MLYERTGSGAECVPDAAQSLDAADFDLTFQTDPGAAIGSFGGDYTYIANPDFDNAVNQSCQVGQIDRNGEEFANTQIEFDSKFDFNTKAGLPYGHFYGPTLIDKDDTKVYLCLFDVHLGNQLHKYKHDSSCYNISKEVKLGGYDSVHAHKGVDLRKDEFIVYNSDKCTIAYIMEIKI
jgi:hypothetical protein